ncbi:MAG: hypothetical protein HQL82_07130 [Magnetococcales bacterium]|nr:hypothetical protein [Magnetococcales bacterium]
MNTTSIDMTKLAKVLNLTFADRDGEILNAARMARRMMMGARLNYDDLFRMATRSEERETRSGTPQIQEVRREYDAIIDSLHRDYNLRLASLNQRIAQLKKAPPHPNGAAQGTTCPEGDDTDINALRRKLEWLKARSDQQIEKMREKHDREIQHLNRRLDFWRNFATTQRT